MENTREAVLVRLPHTLKRQIEACARENLRSMTREIELAVINHVSRMNTAQAR